MDQLLNSTNLAPETAFVTVGDEEINLEKDHCIVIVPLHVFLPFKAILGK